jgi:hypothetical protein
VCTLDEIIARADSILREAFFPTPGPFEMGDRRRKEYQIKLLREVAPNIAKPLIEQIWPEDFPFGKTKLNRSFLIIAIVVAVLMGSLTVGHVTIKYSAARAAIEDHKEAILVYIKSHAKATVQRDTANKDEEEAAKKRAEICEQKLKELEGFWIKYENGWWHILSESSFIVICVVSGLGATAAAFWGTRHLLAHSQMSKPTD